MFNEPLRSAHACWDTIATTLWDIFQCSEHMIPKQSMFLRDCMFQHPLKQSYKHGICFSLWHQKLKVLKYMGLACSCCGKVVHQEQCQL
jgi:hypothetical protein